MGEIYVIFLLFYLHITQVISIFVVNKKNGVNDLRRHSPRKTKIIDLANITKIIESYVTK